MKIKTDPVTNSSTCNFVMVGYEIPIKRNADGNLSLSSKRKVVESFDSRTYHLTRSEIEFEFENISRHGSEIKIDDERGAPDEKTVLVGCEIFNWESDTNVGSASIESLLENIKTVKAEYNFKEEPKFYFGTRMC